MQLPVHLLFHGQCNCIAAKYKLPRPAFWGVWPLEADAQISSIRVAIIFVFAAPALTLEIAVA